MLTYLVRRFLVAIPTVFGVATVIFFLRTLLPGDPAKRAQIYCSASKIVWNDAPWIFLYNQKFPYVTSSKVTNVPGLPNEKFVSTWASPA